MKLFAKLLLVVVVLAISGPYFIKGPDGRPLLDLPNFSIRDISLNSIPSIPSINSDSIDDSAAGTTASSDGIYRWQDDQGQWHYSDSAPDSPNVEKIRISPDTNIIQSLKTKDDQSNNKKDTEELAEAGNSNQSTGKGKSEAEEDSSLPLPLTVPLSEIPKLIDQAKGIQNSLNKRAEQQRKNSGI